MKKALVAGGAGFIGSELHHQLLNQQAIITIGDNLSSGDIKNVERVWKQHGIAFQKIQRD
jgi:UDP-glucose 4-epimerase